VTLLAHARAQTWQQSDEVLQMEIARQNRTVNRTLGKVPIEIWDAQSQGGEGRMRPAPPAALLDLHLSLRCSRRVNNDPTINFEGSKYEITPPSAKPSPSCSITASAFGSSNSLQRTFGPRFSAISPSDHLSGFVPARNPVLNRRRHLRAGSLTISLLTISS